MEMMMGVETVLESSRNMGLLAIQPPDMATSLREFYWIQSRYKL